MKALATAATYSASRAQKLLGLSRSIIDGLVAAGFVSPERGPRNEYRFDFRDLMLLRTAHALQKARIAPSRILRSLVKLKQSLPAELPVTGLRITAVGDKVAVRDASGHWEAESGQLVMDFEVAPVGGDVSFIQPAGTKNSAADWFDKGEALEQTDTAGAEQAYRKAFELDLSLTDAYINLGALLCESKRCAEAVELFNTAIRLTPDAALLHFNRAVALQDLGRLDEAASAYENSLSLDAGLADAHYNLAIVRDKLGDGQGALRHFSAYRRSQQEG